MATRKFYVAAAALLAIGLLPGCSSVVPTDSSPSLSAEQSVNDITPPAPSFNRIGDVVHFDGGGTTGTIVINGVRRMPASEPKYAAAPPKNGTWLVVDFTVKVEQHQAPGGFLVDCYAFEVQPPAGQDIHPDLTALDTVSTRITPGRMVRGQVAFDAPQGDTLVAWSPGLSQSSTTWQVTS